MYQMYLSKEYAWDEVWEVINITIILLNDPIMNCPNIIYVHVLRIHNILAISFRHSP